MDTDTITNLLVEYIKQQRRLKHVLVSTCTKNKNNLPYNQISFSHGNAVVEIKVYNSNFISFKKNHTVLCVNDNIKSARKTIDSL